MAPSASTSTASSSSTNVDFLGTFTLRGDRLEFFGLSEARLEGAVALIERHLGGAAGAPKRRTRSVQDAIAATRAERDSALARGTSGPPLEEAPVPDEVSTAPEARIRELTYGRWIDDPNERLGGASPREAAAGASTARRSSASCAAWSTTTRASAATVARDPSSRGFAASSGSTQSRWRRDARAAIAFSPAVPTEFMRLCRPVSDGHRDPPEAQGRRHLRPDLNPRGVNRVFDPRRSRPRMPC